MIPPVILEDVACPLGCEPDDEIVLTGRDLLHDIPGEFKVVRCRHCGQMRTNPRPTADTIGFYYPDDYGPYISSQVTNTARAGGVKGALKALVHAVLNFNGEKIPPLAPGRLLEVGCASGSFLQRMAAQGWKVQGIEFSAKAAQDAAALGHQVHVGSLETAPTPPEPVDLIVAWMVLEHLHDPVAGLRKLRACAKPDAWLALSVPNAGSLEFRVFRDKWYALQLPTHLSHYTPKTLGQVLEAGGWSIERVFHQRGLGNVIASTGYVMRNRGFAKLGRWLIDFAERGGRWNYVLFPLAWAMSLFGQTGRMTIWARPLSAGD